MKTTIDITAKCSDLFFATLQKDGKTIGKEYNGYVPSFLSNGSGEDYVSLEIDVKTGQILNWKSPSEEDLDELFPKNESSED